MIRGKLNENQRDDPEVEKESAEEDQYPNQDPAPTKCEYEFR
jgi:hypothetical protein